MKHDELRRLAIRLALVESSDGFDVACQECGRRTWNRRHRIRHYADCPIAALEAEEAASKAGIADGARVTIASGEGWSVDLRGEWEPISFDMTDGTSKTGWVRSVPTRKKTAGEFEGEY